MKRLFYSAILLFMSIQQVKAQENKNQEIVGFEYTMVPSAGDVHWNGYHLNAAYEIPVFKTHSVGIQASYQNRVYSFFDSPFNLSTDDFEEIHTIMAGVFYHAEFSNTWSIRGAFSPVISSSLTNEIETEDLQYAGELIAEKYWRKKGNTEMGLKFGVGYGAYYGKPDFFPILSIVGKVKNWNYSLGFPETSIGYDINARHYLNLSAGTRGSYANISESINIQGIPPIPNAKLEYSAVDIGVQHKYRLQPNFTSLVRLGYLSENQLQLLGESDDKLVDFNTDGSLYITMGLTFNFNN